MVSPGLTSGQFNLEHYRELFLSCVTSSHL